MLAEGDFNALPAQPGERAHLLSPFTVSGLRKCTYATNYTPAALSNSAELTYPMAECLRCWL